MPNMFYTQGKIEHFQQMILEKLYVHLYKNEIRSIFVTLHENQLQVNQKPHGET